ncbi:MAG: PBP1A family penicillin-binding protein [Minisyncoccia bacterium]
MNSPFMRRVQRLAKLFIHLILKVRSLSMFLWYGLAVVGVLASLVVIGAIGWAARVQLPSIDNFKDRSVSQSTKIYDRTGKVLLFDLHGNIQRTIIPYETISKDLKNATVAIEDTEFYKHKGIKPTSILRAVFANIMSGSYSQGGSTITQQVVKNTLLTSEKTISRKIKEWILSLALERRISKDEILAIYLNEMPYGGNVYGVEEASRRFFGKSASTITLAEAAYLAALPQAPSYFSPYGNHIEELAARKDLVLRKMLEEKFISESAYTEATQEVVTFAPFNETNIKAPHFVFYIREQLEKKYGTEAVYNGGLTVITTIDWKLQAPAEEIIKRFALKNEKDFDAENASLVAIDPKTGQVLAMVGSRDYFDEKIDGKYNIATALRQPGSTFKPIAYVTAFEKGYTPETVLFDAPTQFSVNCAPDELGDKEGCYSPGNYDDKFRGPMKLRDALAQSINIPAVKVLYLAGMQDVLATAKKLGISTLNKPASFYGFSMVLGGGEVSLLELTGVYATFANSGIRNPITGILEIKDAQGTVLDTFKASPVQALDTQAARQLVDVLSDNNARAPSYGFNSFLNFGNIEMAAKTGTTNDFKDVWIVGFTPDIVVGTWAGNNDNTPIVKKVAGYVIAPMWRAYMNEALKVVPHTKFIKPDPIPYDTLQPILHGDWSNGGKGVHSILYYLDKTNPRGPATSPLHDSQLANWEYAIQKWVSTNSLTLPGGEAVVTPPLAGSENSETNTQTTNSVVPARLTITSPQRGSGVSMGTPITITVSKTGTADLERVEYSIDGVNMGASNGAPFSYTIIPPHVGDMVIRAVGHLKNFGGTVTDQVIVQVQ